MSDWIVTIGLEVHCELKTESKLFCSCPNVFGGEPNSHTCPICSGHPGVMPVLNRRAVEYTVRAGCAIGSKISRYSKWDRKNYFYPDLPKAWQTSQYDLPLCVGGEVKIDVDGEEKTIRLNRIHLEEDAGKLVHGGGVTAVDYNRCGVPLIECVTEPDIHSADEAVAFIEELAGIFRYAGISDCKMQEGSIRADVNLSVARPASRSARVRRPRTSTPCAACAAPSRRRSRARPSCWKAAARSCRRPGISTTPRVRATACAARKTRRTIGISPSPTSCPS